MRRGSVLPLSKFHGDLRRTAPEGLNLDGLRRTIPLPTPPRPSADVLVAGVGGTGIVTLSAMLAAAATMDGKQVRTLDMTGLAQKGGAVFSHVRIGDQEQSLHTARISNGRADMLLACDLISRCIRRVTAAVVRTDRRGGQFSCVSDCRFRAQPVP